VQLRLKIHLFGINNNQVNKQVLSLAKKRLIIAKYIYFSKKLFKTAGFGKNRPFLRPMSTFWAKKGHIKSVQPIWSKNAISEVCFGWK
jgi:hypothetical protein